MKRSNIPGQGVIGGGEGAISTSQEDKTNISGQIKLYLVKFLVLPHPLTNYEIQRFYQNEAKFNGVYSIKNLT